MNVNNLLQYKNYYGTVEFSVPDNILHGKILGIKSSISYEGDSVEDIKNAFIVAVDDYLENCIAYGDIPEISFKDSYNVKIDNDLYRKAAICASIKGIPLNTFIENAINISASF